MNILLGVTGSVAAILTPALIEKLSVLGSVQVIATHRSLHFWKLDGVTVPVRVNADEWNDGGYARGQKVLHIDLRTWADVLVIAPLSADTLAKMANGRADNLLTCVVRAWDMAKPLIVAPAMNTKMWEHPATAEHLATLRRWHGQRLTIVDPISKVLACGDEGMGAMASIDTIAQQVKQL